MPIHIIPTYQDLFPGKVPEPEELLHDISSDLVLNILALINAQIMLGPNTLEYQIDIFKFLTRQFVRFIPELPGKLDLFIRRHPGEVRIFGTPYLLDFMQYELQFYREIPGFIDTNPDQSIRILKAYFVFVERSQEKIDNKVKNVTPDPTDIYWFQRRTWPIMIEQYEINNLPHPGIFAIKAFAFFQYFNEHPTYKKYVSKFLESTKHGSSVHYIVQLMNIVTLGFTKPNEKKLHPFNIAKYELEIKPLLDQLCTNHEEFKIVPNHSKNYNGIRSRPLFNFRGNSYVVLNWHFLYQKLYKGLVFDFYSRSGIKSEFKSLPDYLSLIAEQITEYRFFQPVMKHLLAKKHTIIEIDNKENKRDSQPDLYYRERNQILLAELKDITLPAETVSDYSFEKLILQLDKKLIKNEAGASKGILQLLNHIKQINEGVLDYDHFEQRGTKKRNLKVFPILIYTNFEFSLPGLEDYLRKRFEQELKAYQAEAPVWNIGEVHELVMINFDFFLRALATGEKIDWFDLVGEYNQNLKRRLKKFKKEPSVEMSLKLFVGFEWIHQDLLRKEEVDIETLLRVLEVRI